ncbi:MAG: SDR family oxidoreductase [Gammaproteobacteria bacterium]|nr:SDR family oxidoreductase [Gammaproteobacteria bacterium]
MILITGSTGKTGGEVARQLAAAAVPFRALVRNPDKAAEISALGAELIVGDIADQAFLSTALQGIEKAFLVLPNDEQQLVLEKNFTAACAATGVQHLVYLSSLESVPESKNPITQNHVAAENYIRESGMAWTIMRPTFFNQNFETYAPRIREAGQIVMPVGSGTVSATDLRDVGAVIREVLTKPGHENKSYDLTGPELLTFAEIAERFSKVLGTPVEYIDQPMEEFAELLRTIGLSEWRVDAVCRELEAIGAGVVDHTTDTIEELLGRPPISLEQYISDHIHLYQA